METSNNLKQILHESQWFSTAGLLHNVKILKTTDVEIWQGSF